jgi:hypothetical protein
MRPADIACGDQVDVVTVFGHTGIGWSELAGLRVKDESNRQPGA